MDDEPEYGPSIADGANHLAGNQIHATTVCRNQNGILILGSAGSGKSGLALQLMAFGCQLVADDQTRLVGRDDSLYAQSGLNISGLIEARGIGILPADTAATCRVSFVVNMDIVEKDRLPPIRHCRILGFRLPVVHKVDAPHFAAAVLQFLIGGRSP